VVALQVVLGLLLIRMLLAPASCLCSWPGLGKCCYICLLGTEGQVVKLMVTSCEWRACWLSVAACSTGYTGTHTDGVDVSHTLRRSRAHTR
jgi:hypothetical protein